MWKCSDSDWLCKVTANNIFCDETRLNQMIFMLSSAVLVFWVVFFFLNPFPAHNSVWQVLRIKRQKYFAHLKRHKEAFSDQTVKNHSWKINLLHNVATLRFNFTAGVDYICLKVRRTFIVSMLTCMLQTDAGRHPGIFSLLPLTHKVFFWHMLWPQ